jgi:hypothetical protein
VSFAFLSNASLGSGHPVLRSSRQNERLNGRARQRYSRTQARSVSSPGSFELPASLHPCAASLPIDAFLSISPVATSVPSLPSLLPCRSAYRPAILQRYLRRDAAAASLSSISQRHISRVEQFVPSPRLDLFVASPCVRIMSPRSLHSVSCPRSRPSIFLSTPPWHLDASWCLFHSIRSWPRSPRSASPPIDQ